MQRGQFAPFKLKHTCFQSTTWIYLKYKNSSYPFTDRKSLIAISFNYPKVNLSSVRHLKAP